MESAPKQITETAFRIDKGVPLPPSMRGKLNAKYPFSAMQVGDSFWVSKRDTSGATASATFHGQRYDKKFATRAEGSGRRIWRTA